ncbi:MAG: hypothetical protein V1647_05490, partial [Pseudomonadota bacterium]
MNNIKKELQLFTLGGKLCWPGNYHYLEPWVGCDNNCHFCFARFRQVVKNKVKELGSSYGKPVTLFNAYELISKIKQEAGKNNFNMVRPSRFTDFFSRSFVKNGLAYEILDAFMKTNIPLFGICTKGVPDQKIMDLIVKHKDRIIYDANVRPDTGKFLEPYSPPYRDRLETAAYLNKHGVMTTINLDPVVINIDTMASIEDLLLRAKNKGITRAMFSVLMLSMEIIEHIKTNIDKERFDKILSAYDFDDKLRQVIKDEDDTSYY